MNAPKKIHCPHCGIMIEFSSEAEGKTDTCPSCKTPVWLSHLAEKNDKVSTHDNELISSHKITQGSSSSNSTIIGLLILLILFNLVLGFQVIQLKGQINKRQYVSHSTRTNHTTNAQSAGIDGKRGSSIEGEWNSDKEPLSELLNVMELLDDDIRAEMEGLRSGLTTHSDSINELMDAASHLDTSIESIYEDLSSVTTSLDELSTSLTEVQENQLMLQNLLNQSLR